MGTEMLRAPPRAQGDERHEPARGRRAAASRQGEAMKARPSAAQRSEGLFWLRIARPSSPARRPDTYLDGRPREGAREKDHDLARPVGPATGSRNRCRARVDRAPTATASVSRWRPALDERGAATDEENPDVGDLDNRLHAAVLDLRIDLATTPSRAALLRPPGCDGGALLQKVGVALRAQTGAGRAHRPDRHHRRRASRRTPAWRTGRDDAGPPIGASTRLRGPLVDQPPARRCAAADLVVDHLDPGAQLGDTLAGGDAAGDESSSRPRRARCGRCRSSPATLAAAPRGRCARARSSRRRRGRSPGRRFDESPSETVRSTSVLLTPIRARAGARRGPRTVP